MATLNHSRAIPKAAPDNTTTAAPKVRSTKRRNPQSHQAVLEAAQTMLKEIGYSSITIDQIAERSGVSKATVYRWWPNKAAIFMELYISISRQQSRFPADTGTLEGDLREQIRTAFRLFRKTVAGLALAGFVADAQSNPQTERLLREGFASDIRALNMAVLDRARERGELSPLISSEVAAEVISGAIYYQVLIRHRKFSDADADEIAQVILGGIKAQASAPVKARQRP